MTEIEDQPLGINLTGELVVGLRGIIADKLKEFMGDYMDDTLVDYVLVLLRNGRTKTEAINELNVFLGEDSHSFISWLWDVLAELKLSGHAPPGHKTESVTTKSTSFDRSMRNEVTHKDTESKNGATKTTHEFKRKREWGTLVGSQVEPMALKSSEVEHMFSEERTRGRAKTARERYSPPHLKKVNYSEDEHKHLRKNTVPHATIDAPRRLLQFAVREAVGPLKRTVPSREAALKRLRSVVSTSGEDSLPELQRQRIQPLVPVSHSAPTATPLYERTSYSRSVFDRLGSSSYTADNDGCKDDTVGDEFEEYGQATEDNSLEFLQEPEYIEHEELPGDIGRDTEACFTNDSVSDNEGYDRFDTGEDRIADASQTAVSDGVKGRDSLMVQYSVANRAKNKIQTGPDKAQDQAAVTSNASGKIVNISVNVNTWKPHHYQDAAKTSGPELKQIEDRVIDTVKSVRLPEQTTAPPLPVNAANDVAKTFKEPQKKLLLKPSPSTSGPRMENAESRTIFVTNVHFAATKDKLSQHFNKFGDVLRVILVTDPATKRPKGSAYVEFLHKEAAASALSLDGTSFMSRILKIVRKNEAHSQSSAAVSWPRVFRGGSYPTLRYPKLPIPRPPPRSFRPTIPSRPPTRNLQWKRGTVSTNPPSTKRVIPPTPRSLTYVRPVPKPATNPTPS